MKSISQQVQEKKKLDEMKNLIQNLNLLNKTSTSVNNNSSDHVMFSSVPVKYFVINNALNNDIYNKLNLEYPTLKNITFLDTCHLKNKLDPQSVIMLHSNSLCQLDTRKVNIQNLKDSILSKNWKTFLEYHTSNDFIDHIRNIFYNKFPEMKSSNSKEASTNLNIFFNLCYHLPIFSEYLDRDHIILDEKVAFFGIYLMRTSDDTSKGGNLEIYFQDKIFLNITYQSNCLLVLKNLNSDELKENKKIKIKFAKRNLTNYSQRFITFTITH
jgi:hypothetical protein